MFPIVFLKGKELKHENSMRARTLSEAGVFLEALADDATRLHRNLRIIFVDFASHVRAPRAKQLQKCAFPAGVRHEKRAKSAQNFA